MPRHYAPRVAIVCAVCGTEKRVQGSRAARTKYCSVECYGRRRSILEAAMQAQAGPTCLIPLTRGLYAIVDPIDYQTLNTFTWCATQGRHTFYAARGVWGQPLLIKMHRVIMGVTMANQRVDHIDGNGLNNMRTNLRIATHSQNLCNRPAPSNNTSGYKGVSFDRRTGGWQGLINARGQQYHLGNFASSQEAARAYDAAAVRLHGEFARLNFLR